MRAIVVLSAIAVSFAAHGAQIQRPAPDTHDFNTALIEAVKQGCSCKIDGVGIGNREDKSTWIIQFHNAKDWKDPGDATPDQVAKANAALQAFVYPKQP